MSNLRSGLVAIALAASCGIFAVVGCSADGSGFLEEDSTPTEPGQPGAVLPAPGSSGSSGTPDSGKPSKDAGKDSAVDAGPPPPVPGTACTTLDEVKKKSCGACGTQSTICLAEGSTKKWSVYSGCEGQLAGGCIPGTIVDEPCGNCGTVKKTCTQYCAFTSTSCSGQPTGACVPGGVELSSAGCTAADTFRLRTCGSACTYGAFGGSCEAPPTSVEIGPTPGSVNSTIAILTSGQTLSRITGTCPNATLSTTISTPYTYVQVHNPLAKSATVAIYNSLPTGGVAYKTILAAYDGTGEPTDDATRKACVKIATYGTTALTGNFNYASLDGTRAVTVAAGATVSVLVSAYNAYDAAMPALSTGKVMLNVQTVSLQ